jgi:hypothetical protein
LRFLGWAGSPWSGNLPETCAAIKG